MFGATREAELNRTAEMMIDIVEKHKDNPLKAVANSLYMLRSTNRTDENDLQDLQNILDEMLKKQSTKKVS